MKNVAHVLKTTFLLLFYVLLGIVVWKNREIFHQLSKISLAQAGVLMALQALLLFVNSLFNRMLMKQIGVQMARMEAFFLMALMAVTDFAMPKAGFALRVLYFKKKYNTEFSSIFYIIAYSALFNVAVVALLAIFFSYVGPQANIVLPLFPFLLFPLIPHIYRLVPEKLQNVFPLKIRTMIQSWFHITSGGILILKTSGYSMANQLVQSLIMWFSFVIIAHPQPYSTCVILSSFASLGVLLGISPAGLGIVEAIVYFVGSNLNIEGKNLILISLLVRSSAFTCTAFFGAFSVFVLGFKKETKPKDKP